LSWKQKLMEKLDYLRIISDNFQIIDKSEKSVPFLLNSVQEALFRTLSGKDIVLKARQEGVSSLVLALFTVDFLFMENSRSVCIAHDKDSTIKLFDRVKYFIKSFEEKNGIKVPMNYETRTELVNQSNNAYFYVGTAGSGNFGRSATLTNIHFSEIAFYPQPEKIYLAASQAGNPRRIIIESTAWGYGDFFFKMWTEAVNERNMYRSHFFGWQDFKEYTAPTEMHIEKTTEEREMQSQFHLTDGQLSWRRIKMSEFTSDTSFRREYPMTPDEAFVSSGNPVFNTAALQWYRTAQSQIQPPKSIGNLVGSIPPSLDKQEGGYLRVWKYPADNQQYVIGADTAEGTTQGDYACAQVLDRKTFEQVAVWHGRVDPDMFGRELYRLGMFYNSALIAPERNSIGIAAIMVLRELYYPNLYIRESIGNLQDKLKPELGWVTNMTSKPLMIADAQRAVRDKLITLHDELTLGELFSYQYDESGHANAVTGAHDDRVIALMIAIQMHNRTPLLIQERNSIAEDPNEITGFSSSDNDFSGGEPMP
jgi:hypothetical protein